MKKTPVFVFLLAIAVATSTAYHFINKEWVSFRKAERLFAGQHYAEAVSAYHDALKGGIYKTEIIIRLAQCYSALGYIDESYQYHKKFMQWQPRDPAALSALAYIAAATGQYDEAAAIYREILDMDGKNRHARLQLARMLVWSGCLDEAIREYRILLGESS